MNLGATRAPHHPGRRPPRSSAARGSRSSPGPSAQASKEFKKGVDGEHDGPTARPRAPEPRPVGIPAAPGRLAREPPPPVPSFLSMADGVPTWEEVARDHGRFLYNVAYRLAGNDDDAQDLVQEALITGPQGPGALRARVAGRLVGSDRDERVPRRGAAAQAAAHRRAPRRPWSRAAPDARGRRGARPASPTRSSARSASSPTTSGCRWCSVTSATSRTSRSRRRPACRSAPCGRASTAGGACCAPRSSADGVTGP